MKKAESTIKCKSCRQNIEAHKMFLHEGFCQKNNIFCEHCDKVFLRKDYDNHILEISKNLSIINKESLIKRLKNDFNGFNKDIINNNNNSNSIYNNNTNINRAIKVNHYKGKILKIPIVEEYKIRKPILISPKGDISYGENDDDLLSLFNFDFLGKNLQKSSKYHVIFNTEYNYGWTNNIINYKKNNYYNNRKAININHLNHANILYNNNIFNEKNSILIKSKNKEKKNNLTINISDNNRIDSINIEKNIDEHNFYNKIRAKSNDIDIGNIEYRRYEASNISQLNKPNIIINNNIIAYNNNNNINTIKKNYNKINFNNNFFDTNNELNKISKYNTKTNPYNDRYIRYKDTNIINNLEDSYKKVPLDNISKTNYKNNDIQQNEKKPENRIKKKIKYSVLNTGKKNFSQLMIKCPFCNVFTDNLNLHNNLCKKQLDIKNKKVPLNSKKKIDKCKKVKTLKLTLNNKKEDIDTSSPEENNIIEIKKIKPISRVNYKEILSLKNALLQRGKSQDIILRKKKKKKKATFVNKDYPADTSIIPNYVLFPKNSKRKIVKENENKKTNIRKRNIKIVNPLKLLNNKTFS